MMTLTPLISGNLRCFFLDPLENSEYNLHENLLPLGGYELEISFFDDFKSGRTGKRASQIIKRVSPFCLCPLGTEHCGSQHFPKTKTPETKHEACSANT